MLHEAFATIRLRRPVEFGKNSEPVTELALRPNGSALRDLVVPTGTDGNMGMLMVKPHELARVGIRMAGVGGDKAFVDLMHPKDIWEVAQAVLGFIVGDETPAAESSGSTPSES